MQDAQIQAVRARAMPKSWPLAEVAASLAIALYGVSLFKFGTRDPLGNDLGLQGPLEATLVGLSFSLSLLACLVRRLRLPTLGVLLIIVYGLFALVSSVNSFYPPLSAVKALMLLLTIGIGICLCSAIGARAVLLRFYWIMLALIGLGLLASFLLPGTFPLFRLDVSFRNRLWIFNNHPGVMADYAAVLLLIGLIIRPRPPLVTQLCLLLLNFAAGGRSSVVSLIGLLILGYIWNSRRNLVTFIGRSAILLVILFMSMLVGALVILLIEPLRAGVEYLAVRTVLEAASVNGRTFIWSYALDLIRTHPLLGFGPDGVRDVLLRTSFWASNAHNGYLEILLVAGWIGGGAFFLGWLLTILRTLYIRPGPQAVAAALIHGYLLILGIIGGLIAPNFTVGLFVIVVLAYLSQREPTHDTSAT
jgi:O-antigen ligase